MERDTKRARIPDEQTIAAEEATRRQREIERLRRVFAELTALADQEEADLRHNRYARTPDQVVADVSLEPFPAYRARQKARAVQWYAVGDAMRALGEEPPMWMG